MKSLDEMTFVLDLLSANLDDSETTSDENHIQYGKDYILEDEEYWHSS